MKHFEKLFPRSVELYSYLHDIAFSTTDSRLAITKSATFTLHNWYLLTVICEKNDGRFDNVQLEPKLVVKYLKILKDSGFITSYKSISDGTFNVTLRRHPYLKVA